MFSGPVHLRRGRGRARQRSERSGDGRSRRSRRSSTRACSGSTSATACGCSGCWCSCAPSRASARMPKIAPASRPRASAGSRTTWRSPARLRCACARPISSAWMRRLDAEAENLARGHAAPAGRVAARRGGRVRVVAVPLPVDRRSARRRARLDDRAARARRARRHRRSPPAPRRSRCTSRAPSPTGRIPGVDVLPGLQSSAALFDAVRRPGERAPSPRVSVALAYLSAPTGPDLPSARAALEASLAGFREARRCRGGRR